MTKVVVAMSMSLDGIAGPESADADGMAIFTAILGWQFPLRSWRQEQGMEGGEDSVDSSPLVTRVASAPVVDGPGVVA
jgi:hypothetical protein